jgi:hypothetical protein
MDRVFESNLQLEILIFVRLINRRSGRGSQIKKKVKKLVVDRLIF